MEQLLWAVKPNGGSAVKALPAEKRKALVALLSELLSDGAAGPDDPS